MLDSGPLVQAEQCPAEILLVDSRRLVRTGIVRVLSDSGYLTVSGEVSSCDEAIRLARKQPPQLVLVNLPGSIHRQFPDIGVLVLSDESDLIIQERLLQAGIAGCLSSSCSVEELFGALAAVLRGERYISDSLARKLAERRLPGNGKTPFDQLTHRELQILLLVSAGKTTSAIARDLCLTQKTVNGYRNRLLEKLRAKTEVELMHLAARHGLVRIVQFG